MRNLHNRKTVHPLESFLWEGCLSCGRLDKSSSPWTATYSADGMESGIAYTLCGRCSRKFAHASPQRKVSMNRDIVARIKEIRLARAKCEEAS
jgi:hypothetical protein